MTRAGAGTTNAIAPTLPNGKLRDPKKSARRRDDQPSTAGCCVVWGDVQTAMHEIVAEGIETAAAIAYAFAEEITRGEAAVLSAITAGSIEALVPWPAARIVTIAADRDESKQGVGFKRGEKAARTFAFRAVHEGRQQFGLQLALPGQVGTSCDFLDLLLSEGIASVRAAVLAAEPIVLTPEQEGVRLEDFYAYMEQHSYIYTPTRAPWPGGSVNARLPWVPLSTPDGTPVLDKRGNQVEIPPTAWLDRHRPVQQITWAPGRPTIIRDRLISEGGWIERRNVSVFNLYRPPLLAHGDPDKAGRWIAHVDRVYPEDAEHIRCWLAHRVQRPEDKINHALVLGGPQGIGKDSLIEPVKRAVGPWNVAEPSPTQLTGRFNSFVKSVILRISEAHDLGDIDRYQFYEHLKVYCASPPDVLRVDEKNLREYNALNCCGVIITTNHKTDGIYLPSDDRRHYVAWSNLVKEDFTQDYWDDLWRWYDTGGDRHVAAYLSQFDLSRFNPKAPPPKTPAFWDIVNASRAPEDAELSDTLDLLDQPEAVTLLQVVNKAVTTPGLVEFADWLRQHKNRRNALHRFEACDYVPIRNPDAKDGLWRIEGRRQAIYGKARLPLHEQLAAARKLA